MKIAYITTATGKYSTFIDELVNSGKLNFFPNDETDFIIFTDDETQNFKKEKNKKIVFQKQSEFPYDTLKRYHFVNSIEHMLNYDYLFYGNVNMVFKEKISHNILPDETQNNLLAVAHPGYYDKKNIEYPYERNSKSTAYIKHGEEGNMYYQGCFYGGKKEDFLKMSRELQKNIDEDLKNNIIAIWWDESHTNKYFMKFPPKALSPAYAFPEVYPHLPFKKRILQLNKTRFGGHSFLRN